MHALPLTDRQAEIASQWDRHGAHPFFDASRLQYGRLVFTPLQHFYARCFGEFPRGLTKAIDLGCGSADNLVQLLRTGTIEAATGIELSEQMVANAARLRDRFSIAPERLRILHGSIDRVEVRERFSLILATQILGYVDDVASFMERAATLAAPGAYLFVSDRHHRSLTPVQALKNAAAVRRIFGKPPLSSLGGVRIHPPDEVERQARAAGFQPVWRRYSLHPLSAMGHSAAHSLNERRYAPGLRRALSSAAFGGLAALRRGEDTLLARVPTGYLYAALFRNSRT